MTKRNFISILECPSTNSIICFRRSRKFENEEYYIPRRNITCGETNNLPAVSAPQVNEILLKTSIEVTKTFTVARIVNDGKFTIVPTMFPFRTILLICHVI
jgi:hypothetical protein